MLDQMIAKLMGNLHSPILILGAVFKVGPLHEQIHTIKSKQAMNAVASVHWIGISPPCGSLARIIDVEIQGRGKKRLLPGRNALRRKDVVKSKKLSDC